jgi:sialidase-1
MNPMYHIIDTGIVYRDECSYCGPISMLETLSSGELLVVFRHANWEGPEHQTHAHPSTRTSLVRSRNGGATWEPTTTPDPGGGNGTSLAALGDTLIINNFHWTVVPLARRQELADRAVVREISSIGMVAALDGVYYARSQDGGRSWEEPQRLRINSCPDATTAGRVIALPDGSWLMPMNGAVGGNADTFPWVARSMDGGNSWVYHGTCGQPPVGLGFSENRILLLPDGRILSAVRTGDGNYWQSHSDDGGATWSPITETTIPCLGSSPADLLLLADGRILCTYGNRGRPPLGVRACLSEDGGHTWQFHDEIVLRDDGQSRDMGYPSSRQLQDGSILTVYYWHEADLIRHIVATRWRLD